MWSAENQPLDEAAEWFRARVPMTAEAAAALSDDARSRAFWLAGAQSMRAVEAIQDSLARAIAAGDDFSVWQAGAAKHLRGVLAAHQRTAYRNATQTAYNAGRAAQLSSGVIRKARPFWQYVAVSDAATTDLCRSLHNMILAADDPRWARWLPPNHHGCRATVRALRRREAEARGGVSGVPEGVEQPAGWGAAPSGAALAASHDPALIATWRSKAP